jgi:hypothetical protein
MVKVKDQHVAVRPSPRRAIAEQVGNSLSTLKPKRSDTSYTSIILPDLPVKMPCV